MTSPPDQASNGDARGTRTAIVGGSVVALLAAGWFVLSHFVMDTSTPDAVGEALGVAFALLVVASVIGAVVSGRGQSR
jgi:ribonuclease PH